MKKPPEFFNALRLAGLLAIVILGLVSIIGTGGQGGGGESIEGVTYYLDADGDGYGNPNDSKNAPSQPQGYVTYYTDCDDTNAAVHPGLAESCDDGMDNNCDGQINEGCVCTDADRDGYYAESGCGAAVDCDDTNATIQPGVAEICGDGLDNNCDGQVDEGCTCTDADGDGYYAESGCGTAVDRDDTDADINPGVVEVCGDGLDNNSDGQIDEWCVTGLLPDTGQTICYDADGNLLDPCPAPEQLLSGQDACYNINPPYYTKLDASGNELPDSASSWAMVRDTVTGLIWEAKTNRDGIQNYANPRDADNTYTWNNLADVFIAKLNAQQFGGYSDWRLPTKKELIYLVHYGSNYDRYDVAIYRSYFPNTLSSYYWSSTSYSESSASTWRVHFENGYDHYDNKSLRCCARAVRGGESPSLFTNNGDGTVTDQTTGLMWMQSTANDMTWLEALDYCENLSLAGYDDWRLPTLKELESIVNDEVDDPAVATAYFPDTMSSLYWSSTTVAIDPECAWSVNFGYGGNDLHGKKAYTYCLRAVRGGQ